MNFYAHHSGEIDGGWKIMEGEDDMLAMQYECDNGKSKNYNVCVHA